MLSQYWNLYFIACGPSIRVHRPGKNILYGTDADQSSRDGYPQSHALGSSPPISFIPANEMPHNLGYIDRGNPLDINQILIGNLGDEEILLCSTDNGNVAAYHTKGIEDMFRKRDELESEVGQQKEQGMEEPDNFRPFFCENVGSSAWGLAIHSEARMIAVSSNTHTIDLFAFALERTISKAEDTELSTASQVAGRWNSLSFHRQASEVLKELASREKNVHVSLKGHSENIPSVAFCNIEEYPAKVVLASTDIRGDLKLWTINITRHSAQIRETICNTMDHFGNPGISPHRLR